RRVVEGAADAPDAVVEAALEVDEGVGGPDLPLQLVARHQLPGPAREGGEDLGRLGLQAHPRALGDQLARVRVELEAAEAQHGGQRGGGRTVLADGELPLLSWASSALRMVPPGADRALQIALTFPDLRTMAGAPRETALARNSRRLHEVDVEASPGPRRLRP